MKTGNVKITKNQFKMLINTIKHKRGENMSWSNLIPKSKENTRKEIIFGIMKMMPIFGPLRFL